MRTGTTHQRSRSGKFVRDLGIYAIGNLGSKIITFAMVPLYTFFVKDTGDFGYYDLCLTAVFLLISVVTLQLRDGAFRFLLGTKNNKHRSEVINYVYRSLIVSALISVFLTLLIGTFFQIKYLWYCFALLVVMSFYEVIAQVARGLGDNKTFAISGIISSLGIGVFSIIFVVILPWEIEGIFIANILARIIAFLFIEFRLHIGRDYFTLKADVRKIGREIIRYTWPLLVCSICFWVTECSSRWFIEHYLGLAITGVYAVAFRFNSIILTLATIYYQAWQEAAILQYHSVDRDRFFSRMFNSYISILAVLLVGYTFTLKIFYPLIVSEAYRESVSYLYPMGVSAVLFSLSAFFDMGYQCAKDTSRTLPAIVLAAAVNVALNFALVPRIGVYGAIATSIVTYLVLFLYRLHDMKRYFSLSLHPRSIIPALIIPSCALPFYLLEAWWALTAAMVAAVVVVLFSLPGDFRQEIMGRIAAKTGFRKQ